MQVFGTNTVDSKIIGHFSVDNGMKVNTKNYLSSWTRNIWDLEIRTKKLKDNLYIHNLYIHTKQLSKLMKLIQAASLDTNTCGLSLKMLYLWRENIFQMKISRMQQEKRWQNQWM